MSDLPRIMLVVWRWGNSDEFRLPKGHTHVEWSLDASDHADDRFVQVDLRAREALPPLTELISRYLGAGNVLLFLHDHQDYGFSSEFRGRLIDAIGHAGGSRIGQLYVRLFTGGKEPLYCTPQFLKGILGSGGNFASDLVGLPDRVPVVRKYDPNKGERILNAEHFNAVWQHYWQHSRQSEKLGYLKENFARWAHKYDDELCKDTPGYGYPYYLQKDPDLWKALASFTQNESILHRLSKNGETPSG
ncbi:MAG: hypothetical protein L6Q97_25750, partial [Thermoanaerobaculia bacterium]|nr:hypothetical protein [Thermoanaerobaculia bacterium]